MASSVENYLNSLGKYVVKQSRTMLTKAKKNVNKDLYNSISYKVVPDGDGFALQFFMLNYGKFVDKGVSGNKKIQDYTTWDKRKVESPLAYLISRSIKRDGIKSLSFFQRPLGLGLKDFPKDLLNAVKQDIIDTLNKTTVN